MALPGVISYCKITGLFLEATADTSGDPDDLPQGNPLVGAQVTFRAAPSAIKTSDPAATTIPRVIECLTDASGYIYNPAGTTLDESGNAAKRGVRILASDDPDIEPHDWSWSFAVKRADLPTIIGSFIAHADGEIDLATVVNVPASPGAETAAWIQAVSAATDARDAAQSAASDAAGSAADADTARGQAVTAKTDAETARTDSLQARMDAQSAAGIATTQAGTATAQAGLASTARAAAEAARDALLGAADVAATGDSLAQRTPSGTLVVAPAVASGEAVTLGQAESVIADKVGAGGALDQKLLSTYAALSNHRRGSGSPVGVVTPTDLGQVYADTAQTLGARLWISTGTTSANWKVLDGDTGWRNIAASVGSDWTIGGTELLELRRVNGVVEMRGKILRAATAGTRVAPLTVYATTTGFKPERYVVRGACYCSTAGSVGVLGNMSSLASLETRGMAGNWAANDVVTFAVSWSTPDAWPTTLPGSAA